MDDTPADPRGCAMADVVGAVRALTLETQHYIDEVARRLGAHRTDVAAIGLIIDAGRQGRRLTPGELARRAGLSAAAVSALVDRLERAGHATRARHEHDRRMVVVDATDTARAVSRAMFTPLTVELTRSLEHYTDDELDLVARALADLATATRLSLVAGPGDPTEGR